MNIINNSVAVRLCSILTFQVALLQASTANNIFFIEHVQDNCRNEGTSYPRN
jgi:hypothetical protein